MSDPNVRLAAPSELATVANHFRRMWLDTGFSPESIRADWRSRIDAFMEHAQRERQARAFVALEGGAIVGSAVGQLWEPLSPAILRDKVRKYGYIWGVYVDPAARRLGLGAALTRATMEYLESIDCTRILLHASPQGRPIYINLGFAETNELALELPLTDER